MIGESGSMQIAVPRDRAGSFEPLLVPKWQKKLPGFEEKIIALYARGMTVRDIKAMLEAQYHIEVSPDFISSVTDAVHAEVCEWQNRPLERMYPLVFFDALRVRIRDEGTVRSKAVYLALGVEADGTREILGLWIEQNEGAKFWLKVMNELRNRGVEDVLIAVVDGLRGFPEAINAVFPETQVQTCIVHLIRHSLSYCGWKEREAVAAGLKLVYRAEKARLIAAKKLRPEKPLPKITPAEIPFEIPQGWEWCRLDDFLNVRAGIAKGGKHYKEPTTPTPYLRVANVQRGYLDLDEIKYLDLPASEVTKYALEDGDLLVTEGGDPDKVGRCAVWRKEIKECVHQNHIFSMRPYADASVELEFVPLMLNSPFCQTHFLGSYKQTTNLASINKTVLRSTPIPLPPIAEQAAIVERVEALMEHCRALAAEIEHTRTHAAHLLQAVLKEAFAPGSNAA